MSTVRLLQLSTPEETTQKTIQSDSIPLVVHHIWFSTPLPKKIAFPHDEQDRGDIFEKLKAEHNANKHLENFRLILWTNGADNSVLEKFIADNKLEKIEIKHYNSLRAEPECQGFDATDEEIMQLIAAELTQAGGNPGAASDMSRLLALKHFGGFYGDVNDEPPYIFSANETLTPSLGCWVGGYDDVASNNLLAAVKNHPLIQETLTIIVKNYREKGLQFIFEERKTDRTNAIQHSGPGPLQQAIANIFNRFTFFNRKIYCIGVNAEGRDNLFLCTQKFFTAANPNYRMGMGASWIKSEFASQRPLFFFNDAEIIKYENERPAISRLYPS